MKIKAPFTDDQVKHLNEYQNNDRFHPFTCGTVGCIESLVATNAGWVCPRDDYTQDWAWDFMAKPLPPEHKQEQTK